MNHTMINIDSDYDAPVLIDFEISKLSSRWGLDQWNKYLSLFEIKKPDEEILIGSTFDLESFVSKYSDFGCTPSSSIEQNVKLKNQKGEL